jgi:hypothetical protein
MKRVTGIFLLLLISSAGIAQTPASLPCSSNPVYRQFDFWLGEWEAFSINGKKAGDSRIERLLDSCVILENWTSMQGGFSGKSYNTYNTATGKWQQFWVDNKGGSTDYSDGHYEAGKMIFLTQPLEKKDGKKLLQRLTFYQLQGDKVRQHGEHSADGGATWITDYDLEYRRKKSN